MRIRNSAKAIIIQDNALLVIKLKDDNGIYYLLPGGGQEPGEMLPDFLVRECREETGYEIEADQLVYVRECFMDEGVHRIEFMFSGRVIGELGSATEMDEKQISIEWINLKSIVGEPLYPFEMRSFIQSWHSGEKLNPYVGNIS